MLTVDMGVDNIGVGDEDGGDTVACLGFCVWKMTNERDGWAWGFFGFIFPFFLLVFRSGPVVLWKRARDFGSNIYILYQFLYFLIFSVK